MADNEHQDHAAIEHLTDQELRERVNEVITRDKDRRRRFRRRVQRAAAVIVIIAGLAGGLLILASTHTRGYWSSFLSALGAGALAGAVFAMAAPLIAGLWHAGDESNEFMKTTTRSLQELSDDLQDLWNETITPRTGIFMSIQRASRDTAEIDHLRHKADEPRQNPQHQVREVHRMLIFWYLFWHGEPVRSTVWSARRLVLNPPGPAKPPKSGKSRRMASPAVPEAGRHTSTATPSAENDSDRLPPGQ
jgi:hypothetical protein